MTIVLCGNDLEFVFQGPCSIFSDKAYTDFRSATTNSSNTLSPVSTTRVDGPS